MANRRSTRCVLLAACAAASLAACSSVLGPDEPTITVSLSLEWQIAFRPVLLADIGGRRVEARAAERNAPRAHWEVKGPRYGEVPVRAALLSEGGDTLAVATFTQRLRRDHDHWIAALVGQRRPVGHCIGQLLAVPLSVHGADTLFVMYGGIAKDAIC